MALTPATIKSADGARKRSRRYGRGNSSGRGTYSGRGGKGQTARSGGKSRTSIRALKPYLQKIPKLRGFKSIYPKDETITLQTLERTAKEGDRITPAYLAEKKLIANPLNGAKIVATGELKKKLDISGIPASKKAVEMIEKAGGTVKF